MIQSLYPTLRLSARFLRTHKNRFLSTKPDLQFDPEIANQLLSRTYHKPYKTFQPDILSKKEVSDLNTFLDSEFKPHCETFSSTPYLTVTTGRIHWDYTYKPINQYPPVFNEIDSSSFSITDILKDAPPPLIAHIKATHQFLLQAISSHFSNKAAKKCLLSMDIRDFQWNFPKSPDREIVSYLDYTSGFHLDTSKLTVNSHLLIQNVTTQLSFQSHSQNLITTPDLHLYFSNSSETHRITRHPSRIGLEKGTARSVLMMIAATLHHS